MTKFCHCVWASSLQRMHSQAKGQTFDFLLQNSFMFVSYLFPCHNLKRDAWWIHVVSWFVKSQFVLYPIIGLSNIISLSLSLAQTLGSNHATCAQVKTHSQFYVPIPLKHHFNTISRYPLNHNNGMHLKFKGDFGGQNAGSILASTGLLQAAFGEGKGMSAVRFNATCKGNAVMTGYVGAQVWQRGANPTKDGRGIYKVTMDSIDSMLQVS